MMPEFLSGEASASPAVEPLLAGARRLADDGFPQGAVSARNGSRATTHAQVAFGALQAGDFIEVADYDPKLERVLCIGRRDPHPMAGLLHLMYRAKKELNAIVIVELDAARVDAVPDGVPRAARGKRPLDDAFAVLERLRSGDAVLLERNLVVVAPTVRGAFARTRELLGLQA